MQLSAQLKTRLSYAMVKVQNGWEKQSLDELEEVHSQRGSPNSAPGRTDRLAFESPSGFGRQRRPSGVSDNSDQMLMSPASDPSGAHMASSSRQSHRTPYMLARLLTCTQYTGERRPSLPWMQPQISSQLQVLSMGWASLQLQSFRPADDEDPVLHIHLHRCWAQVKESISAM
jgi:hypothetical protein